MVAKTMTDRQTSLQIEIEALRIAEKSAARGRQ